MTRNLSEKYDLIVIGAGPAGVMASITAADKSLKVLLVERKKHVSRINRSCCSMWINEPMTHGESISVVEGGVLFRNNNFFIDYTGETIPLKQYIRLSPGGKKIVFEDQNEPVSIVFDKKALLEGLLRRAESSGVKLLNETLCVDVTQNEEKVSVKLRNSAGENIVDGENLILADGVNSSLGARLGFNKDRKFLGRFQALSCFFENVACPYPPSFISFIGSEHLNGGLGNIYMLPKPGIIEGRSDIFEVTIGSPAGDSKTLLDKMKYFTEEGFFSGWFRKARLVRMNSAVLDFRTPLSTPVKGRTLVAGDAAAFIETYVQGAIMYGRSAAEAVIGNIREGKDFSSFINFWRETYGYNQPGEIEKATQAYSLNRFSGADLDYLFSLTDNEIHKGYVNEFNDFERIMKAFSTHIKTIRNERPVVAKSIESYFEFKESTLKHSLQLADLKD